MSIESVIKRAKGSFVSPVRCIKKVYPVKDAPAFALVVTAGKADDHEKRMEAIKLLNGYNAVCSFAVTQESADDREFIKAALDGGFELVNGGSTGRPFSDRGSAGVPALHTWENVYSDVKRLHDRIEEEYGYKMTAGMPPYGVTYIDTAVNAFDLYDYFNYQLIKGSMNLKPGEEGSLSAAIASDKNALNGQVVTASLESVPAIAAQFEALGTAGYGVCGVSDLLAVSPFSDIGPDSPVFEPAKRLIDAGYPIAFRNNNVNPKPYEIMGDTLTTLSTIEARGVKVDRFLNGKTMVGKISIYNQYAAVIYWARTKMGKVKFDFPTTSALFVRALLMRDIRVNITKRRLQYRRAEMVQVLADILCATENQDPYGVYEYHMSSIEYELRQEMGDEAFEQLKAEVDAKKAEEAAAGEEKKEEEGTILDRFDRKKKADEALETEEDAEHKDIEVNKDQIVL